MVAVIASISKKKVAEGRSRRRALSEGSGAPPRGTAGPNNMLVIQAIGMLWGRLPVSVCWQNSFPLTSGKLETDLTGK